MSNKFNWDNCKDELCTCGHLKSRHYDAVGGLAKRHGACTKCLCPKFTWDSFVMKKSVKVRGHGRKHYPEIGNPKGYHHYAFADETAYAGKVLKLREVFDEDKQPRWMNEAQSMIDGERSIGKSACVLHKGNLHGYYSE